MQRRYRAFISYSWADKAWGDWLHRSLELYRTPAALVGRETPLGPVPRGLHPIFKDREEEAAGGGIGEAIEAAMGASDFLIVVCSPRSAKSKWVNREVAWFKTHKPRGKVLALVVEGEPGASLSPNGAGEECFPATLLYTVDENLQPTDHLEDPPLAADARKEGDGKRLAKLKIAAALLGVGLDDLVKRDDRRRAIRRRWAMAGMGAVSASMTALAWVAMDQRDHAVAMQAQAETQRDQAEGLVEYMIGDLTETLQQEVQLKVLGDMATRAREYYQVQMDLEMDDEALSRRVRVLDLLSSIEQDLGNIDVSSDLARQSLVASQELIERHPQDPEHLHTHLLVLRGLGSLAFEVDDIDGAETRFRQALIVAEELQSVEPENVEWEAEQGVLLANIGVMQFKNNDFSEAIPMLEQAVAVKRAAIEHAHSKRQAHYDLAVILQWLSKANLNILETERAKQNNQEEFEHVQTILSNNPKYIAARRRLALNKIIRAEILYFDGLSKDALLVITSAVHGLEQLVQEDPAHTGNVLALLEAKLVAGEIALASEDFERASGIIKDAQLLIGKLEAVDADRVDWSGVMKGKTMLLQRRISAGLETDLTRCAAALNNLDGESERLINLSRSNPKNLRLAQVAAETQLLRGDSLMMDGLADKAMAAWETSLAILKRPLGDVFPLDFRSQRLRRELEARLAQNNPDAAVQLTACAQSI
ncbi:MAG: TIR domain-containing protein [Pseudomonadota bacterium]